VTAQVDAARLPPFTNHRAVCAACGRRFGLRVHFDRDCPLAHGDHFHRVCECGERWLERVSEDRGADRRQRTCDGSKRRRTDEW